MKKIQVIALSFLLIFWQLCIPLQVLAQSAPRDLDLSSTTASVSAAHANTIVVNGESHQVNIGDLITPAMSVALSQVVHSSSGQSIVIGANGAATGGSFNISRAAPNGASNVVIPQSVTAVHDAAALANLTITQNLTNAGTYQVLSQNTANTAANISALNIINQQSGLITSILPPGGMAGYTPAISSVTMQLNAVQDIINSGAITSSANLIAIAGGNITNALPLGVTGSAPVMQAMNNLDLFTGAGSIVNSGILNSIAGNINIATVASATDLVVNNLGGQIQALAGIVNIRDSLFAGNSNTVLWQGNLSANALNFFGGTGIAQTSMQEIVGLVNINSGSGNLNVLNGDLAVGNVQIDGDVSINNANGNVYLYNDISATGKSLSLGAGGNIESKNDGLQLTAGPNQNFNTTLSILAGADMDMLSLDEGLTAPFDPSLGGWKTSPSPTLASATGGNIDFTTHPISMINVKGQAGGSTSLLTMIARQGTVNDGNIDLPEQSQTILSNQANFATARVQGQNLNLSGIIDMSGTGDGSIQVLSVENANIGSIYTAPTGSILVKADNVTGSVQVNDHAIWQTGYIYLSAPSVSLGADSRLTANVPYRLTSSAFFGTIYIGTYDLTLPSNSSSTLQVADGYADIAAGPLDLATQAGIALTIHGSQAAEIGELKVEHTLPTESIYTGGGTSLNDGAAALLTSYGHITIDQNASITSDDAITVNMLYSDAPLSFTNNGTLKAGSGNYSGVIKIESNQGAPNVVPQELSVSSQGSILVNEGTGTPTVEISNYSVLKLEGQIAPVVTGQGSDHHGVALYVTADSIETQGTNPVVLSANGTGSGDAGVVYVSTYYDISGDAGLAANANASGSGNGGYIYLATDALNTQSNVVLSANGGESGNGGQIEATVGAGVTTGTGAGELIITATGGSPGDQAGNGGIVSLQSYNDIDFDPAAVNVNPQGDNGDGGSIQVSTFGKLNLAGPLAANGVGTGKGGNITLETYDYDPIVLDSSVELHADGGIGGDGGSVTVMNHGAGGIVYAADANITANQGSAGGSSGAISLVADYGPLVVSKNLDQSGTGATGSGGTVHLEGAPIVFDVSGPLVLTANASGSGNGGRIEVTNYGWETDLTIGPDQDNISISATGGSTGSQTGNGGRVSLTAGRDLVILSLATIIGKSFSTLIGCRIRPG